MTLSLLVLEDRTAPAMLDIVMGALCYQGQPQENNNLTVSYSSGSYGFQDSGALITLGAGARAAGWRGSGTHTVTGSASQVGSLSITPGDGTCVINLRTVLNPTDIYGGQGSTQVNLGSLAPFAIGNLGTLQAPVTIHAAGNTSVTASDHGGRSGSGNIDIGPTGITGLSPYPITFAGPTLASLCVTGSSLGENYLIHSPPTAYLRLDTGAGNDTVTVTGNTTGDAYLGSGDDTFVVNPGVTWTGNVHTGGSAGDVVLQGDNYGTITGTVSS